MSGRKPKEIKKAQYYVWYLGWRECRGVWGREFTEPIARDLLHTRRGEELPKLTLEVSRKELKIVQLVEKKKGKTEKIKYPPIPAKDVTYAVQVLSPDEDVVACIYLGYNPQTRCAVHVHVYRCDSLETAGILTAHLNQLIELPEHQQRVHKIEQELVAKGQVVPRPNEYGRFINNNSDGHSTTRTSSSEGDQDRGDIYGQQQQQQRPPRSPLMSASREEQNEPGPTPEDLNLYDSLAAELRAKLGSKDHQPILLPPKDYDTVHRSKGRLMNLEDKKATNEKVVGDIGAGGVMVFGEDSARGDSDNGSYGRNSQNGEQGGGSEIAAAVQGMPWPTIQVEEDRGSTGSDRAHGYPYHSNGVPEDPYDVRRVPEDPYDVRRVPEDPYDVRRVPEDPYDVRPGRNARPPVSPRRLSPPRQERSARRDLSPGIPRSPRGGSPMPKSRELSPVRYQPAVGPPSSSGGGGRPMSPPPELRNSYFPNKGLPNYLASDGDLYNTSAVFDHRLPSRGGSHGGGGGVGAAGGSKYTASSLGLTDRGGGGGPGGIMRNPSARDEGYRSMDRQDNRRPLSGQYYDNPYAASMDRLNRSGPVGPGHVDSMYPPPHGAGYKPRRAYNEMPPPDYARGGGGFDYLP